MNEPKTPGEAAYIEWMISQGVRQMDIAFDDLSEHYKARWHRISDAAIRQAKSIIAQEMVKDAGVTQQRSEVQ